jgi:hypothetical protein
VSADKRGGFGDFQNSFGGAFLCGRAVIACFTNIGVMAQDVGMMLGDGRVLNEHGRPLDRHISGCIVPATTSIAKYCGRRASCSVSLAALFWATAVHTDEAMKISLKDIWTYEMPAQKVYGHTIFESNNALPIKASLARPPTATSREASLGRTVY